MLFDVITTLILFSVLSRLTGRRRGDVLYYVSNTNYVPNTNAPRRSSVGPNPSRRGIVRSTGRARKFISFSGAF
jgi:hypothetical protein